MDRPQKRWCLNKNSGSASGMVCPRRKLLNVRMQHSHPYNSFALGPQPDVEGEGRVDNDECNGRCNFGVHLNRPFRH
jgi:hypothetical protein